MIKIGDKVRFLDSVGGGIVRRFNGKDIAMVEDEDGFEIPTLVNQCVAVNDDDDARASGHAKVHEAPRQPKPQVPSYDQLLKKDKRALAFDDELEDKNERNTSRPGAKKMVEANAHIDLDKPVRVVESKEGEVLNTYLAFLPSDDRHLQDSNIYCYFINDSNYWTFFTLLSRKDINSDTYECRYTGLVEPNTKLQLFSIERRKVDDLENCTVQLLAFKRDRPFTAQSPMHIDIRLNTNRFFKLHSFTANDFFEQDALLQPIVKNGRPFLPMKLDEEEIAKGIREKVRDVKSNNQSKPSPKPVIARNGAIEVDLHINELLETTTGMDKADILQHQLDVFKKTMDTYRSIRGQKIIFIHGKGEGVLRKAILDELKAHYAGCSWQDASFQQYGFGATQVTIKK